MSILDSFLIKFAENTRKQLQKHQQKWWSRILPFASALAIGSGYLTMSIKPHETYACANLFSYAYI